MNLVSVRRSKCIRVQPGVTASRGSYNFFIGVVLAILLATSIGCGGSGSSSSPTNGTVTISISPTNPVLPVSSLQQFSAAVTNTTNTAVTWQVNGTTGGSSTNGTISTSGLYTAPSAVPATAITVTAISSADSSKTASATVTVTNANSLVVSPTQATVAAGGQQTFAATLGGQSLPVTWSLTCNSNAVGACGTMSGAVYTAPLSPPPQQWVSVKATSTNNSANPASASVTIQFGNGTLSGSYAFSMRGVKAGQPFAEAGSIVFDGKGGITGGTIDRNNSAAPGTITGGSYASDVNGRVTATVHTNTGDEGWQITVVNHSQAQVMRVDSAVAEGTLNLQDTSQFGRTLTGPFTFLLTGSSSAPISLAGSVGALDIDAQGIVTGGRMDVNDGGTVSSNLTVSSAITASDATTGRGTLSISSTYGTLSFAYYLVDSFNAELIEIDASHDYTGKLTWRSGTTVTADNFAGTYAFVFSGANSTGAVGQGGNFQLDSNGNVSNGTFDTSTDSAFSLGFLFSGTLQVTDPATGRSVVTLNVGGSTLQYVVYPRNQDLEVPFLEIDNKNLTTGLAIRFTNVPSGNVTLSSGQFAMAAGEIGTTVQRTVAGSLALPGATGLVDVNDSGNVTLGTAVQTSLTVTSSYGRSQLILNTGTGQTSFTTYILDQNNILMLETDGKGVLTGRSQRRY
jgi:hypothetical protein